MLSYVTIFSLVPCSFYYLIYCFVLALKANCIEMLLKILAKLIFKKSCNLCSFVRIFCKLFLSILDKIIIIKKVLFFPLMDFANNIAALPKKMKIQGPIFFLTVWQLCIYKAYFLLL